MYGVRLLVSPDLWCCALRSLAKSWLMLAVLAMGATVLFDGLFEPSRIWNTSFEAFQVSPQFRLEINQATAAQLQTLPDVGIRLAERIVDYRSTHGPFKNIEELLEVRGLGELTLARLRSMLWLDDYRDTSLARKR